MWPLPFSTGPTKAPHLIAGKQGEDVATQFLRAKGYRILERNARIGKDEIDIVAFDPVDQVVVFVEVKTRTSDGPYVPEMNVTTEKRKAMTRAARRWMARAAAEERGNRLDVITVVGGKVRDHFLEIEV